MLSITYIDKSFGNREEVEKYIKQIREKNIQDYNNKKEFKKLFKMMKKL